MKPKYTKGFTYQALERLIESAGVKIMYEEVPDDHIDGAIWARSDLDMNAIMMPDSDDAFPDEQTACMILGHEMGHILTRLDSPDLVYERQLNEAKCDIVGVYLAKFAEMIAGTEIERSVWGA